MKNAVLLFIAILTRVKAMDYAQTNKSFLDGIRPSTRTKILKNIAAHYEVSTDAAYNEVATSPAEHLCDYITGNDREVIYLLMAPYSQTKRG